MAFITADDGPPATQVSLHNYVELNYNSINSRRPGLHNFLSQLLLQSKGDAMEPLKPSGSTIVVLFAAGPQVFLGPLTRALINWLL